MAGVVGGYLVEGSVVDGCEVGTPGNGERQESRVVGQGTRSYNSYELST